MKSNFWFVISAIICFNMFMTPRKADYEARLNRYFADIDKYSQEHRNPVQQFFGQLGLSSLRQNMEDPQDYVYYWGFLRSSYTLYAGRATEGDLFASCTSGLGLSLFGAITCRTAHGDRF